MRRLLDAIARNSQKGGGRRIWAGLSRGLKPGRVLEELRGLEEPTIDVAEELAGEQTPGFRRHAARIAGNLGGERAERLLEEMGRRERVESVVAEVAIAAAKLNRRELAEEIIDRHLSTAVPGGERRLASATGVTREGLLSRLDDEAYLVASKGRGSALNELLGKPSRGESQRSLRLHGVVGDPRSIKPLTRTLAELGGDPGGGYARRRLSARSLGMIGLPTAIAPLLRALNRERQEFEGKPGAGMGVQYPVRNDIIQALGELQAVEAIPQLLELLDEREVSPRGGMHLPAMAALLKIGPPAIEALEAHARESMGRARANAEATAAAIRSTERQL